MEMIDDEKWEQAKRLSGDALDMAIDAGGAFSMRRQGSVVKIAVVPGQSVLSLTKDETLTIATSLLAAVYMINQGGSGV